MKFNKFLDKAIGIETFVTKEKGIGGIIKESLEDFIVKEILYSFIHEIKGSKDYIWLYIKKESIDTPTLLYRLSKCLKCPISKIAAGGLKDARSVSYQYISIPVSCFNSTISKCFSRNIVILKTFYMPIAISTTMLYGNAFSVVIKEPVVGKEIAMNRIINVFEEASKGGGIPNFFGYQRFGSIRPVTHLIGYYILKNKVEDAIREIVGDPFPLENERVKEARRLFNENKYKESLITFPPKYYYERFIIRMLIKTRGNFRKAFNKIPFFMKRIFIEAFQSYLFNRMLSLRILRGYSLNKAYKGDYIGFINSRGEIGLIRLKNSINEEKIDGYSKVLLAPIIGIKTKAFVGILKELYGDILNQEGVSLSNFKKNKLLKYLSAYGGYRVLSFIPEETLIELIHENDIKINFILRRGTYATTFLREIMKYN